MEREKLIEVAEYCQEKYKATFTNPEQEKYINTLFVAINEDDIVKCSYTTHILQNATQCILIHKRTKKAYTKWYDWYKLEYIDSDGAVFEKNIGNGYELYVTTKSSYSCQNIFLEKDDYTITQCKPPFEDHMQSIWNLYKRCQQCCSMTEVKLLSRLYKKENDASLLTQEIEGLILTNKLLEQELDRYKDLLDNIKDLVEKAE